MPRQLLHTTASLTLLAALVLLPGADPDPLVIQLKWNHQFQFAGYYMALHHGYFAEEGLDVQLRPVDWERDDPELLREGLADYVIADATMLLSHLHGEPIALVCQIFQLSPLVVFARRDRGILAPEDLVDRSLDLEPDNASTASITAMLHRTLGGLEAIDLRPRGENTQALIDGDLDAMVGYVTDRPFILRRAQVPYTILDPLHHGIDFPGDALFTSNREITERPDRVAAVRRAVIRGWQTALEDPESCIRLIRECYAPGLGRDQLAFESRLTRRMVMPDLVPIGEVNVQRYQRMAELFAELGMADQPTIGDDFFTAARLSPEPGSPAQWELTAEEQDWLAQNPTIRVAIDPHYPPLEYVQDGEVRGLTADLLALLASELPCRFELEPSRSWQDSLARFQAGEVDLLPAMAATSDRRDFGTFTEPWCSLPIVLYSDGRHGFIADLADLHDHRIGAVEGSASVTSLLIDHPDLTIVPQPTVAAGLDALESGEIDFFLGVLPVVNYQLGRRGSNPIHVAAQTPYRLDFAIGVRPDLKPLRAILDKTLANLPSGTMIALQERWMNRQAGPEMALDWLWWVLGGVVALVLALILLNRHLARIVGQRTSDLAQANADLQAQIGLREDVQADIDRLNALLHGLLDALPASLIAVDGTDRIRYCNESARAEFGGADDTDRPVTDLLVGHAGLDVGLQRTRRDNRPWSGERQSIDGRIKQVHCHPLAGDGILIRIEDLTDQVRMEGELVQARKLECVGQLAGGIAHDFNNILQIIDGTAELLRLQYSADDRLVSLADRVSGACKRASELTAGLLGVSRPRPVGRVPVGLADLLQEIVGLCRHTFSKAISIEMPQFEPDARILADPGELHSALLNIAINARDAMPHGGRLVVAGQVDPDNREATITISDTGVGMDQATRERIFEPFFTTKGLGNGTGLGLSGTYRTIVGSGGRIAVESEPGRGTTFTIHLPVHDLGTATVAADPPTDLGALDGLSILVIDDEELIRDTVVAMVQEHGGSCLACADGPTAIARFTDEHTAIDLVLVDMVMPRMHGAEVLRSLADIDPQLRAVVMSGHIPDSIKRQLPADLVLGWLQKPFTSRDLLVCLREAMISQ